MRYSEKIEHGVMYIAAVLLCLTLVSSYLMGNIYARFATQAAGEDSARVALFGSSESITLPENITSKMIPGSSRTYTLTVSNAKADGKISEVAQNYNMEVITAGNLPLTFTLKKEDTKIAAEKKDNHYTYQTEAMSFPAGQEESHIYTLTVEWPANKNNASYANIPDLVKININVEQVD